jgi:prephenate dehydratase
VSEQALNSYLGARSLASMTSADAPPPQTTTQRIAFLGPFGTFTEQALRSVPELDGADLIAYRTVPDVLDAVTAGEADAGFVPIENSIEGMVNFTLDALAFDHDLLIVREVVLDIHLCLAARPGIRVEDVKEILSIPVATAQCHRYLREYLPFADVRSALSTAAAAQLVSEDPGPHMAAIAPRIAAERYGLDVIAENIEDHEANQTRFVLVRRSAVPAPTGHDRTALVIYQRADEPGSLISILQEFAARRLNLSNLISRPTKEGGLGDYCFIIFADGHIADDLVADAMRALHAKQGAVKFFGSWPRADNLAHDARAHADERWRAADDWISGLRRSIGG